MCSFQRSVFVLSLLGLVTSSLSSRLIRSPAEGSSTSSSRPTASAPAATVTDNERCGFRRTTNKQVQSSNPPDEYAQFAEFPWIVVILQTSSGTPTDDSVPNLGLICSGSLISPSVVLTAAHCVSIVDPKTLRIRAGVHDINDPSDQLPYQERTVKQMTIHGNYSKRALYNDIALLSLTEPFSYDHHIGPICTPIQPLYATADSYNVQNCLVPGWGRGSRADRTAVPQKLKKVHVDVISNEYCESRLRTIPRLGTNYKLHPSYICAQEQDLQNNVCEGYGGAPLACPLKSNPETYVQVGVTSWGVGCNGQIPGIYSSLASNSEWLNREFTAISAVVTSS